MKKFIFNFSFLVLATLASQAQAQYYPYSGYSGYYNYGYGSYNFLRGASTADKVGFGINQFFNTLDYTTARHQQMKAQEAYIGARQNQLENYKSLQRLQTEGPVPFAPVGPDGRKRSENITWEDVQNIR